MLSWCKLALPPIAAALSLLSASPAHAAGNPQLELCNQLPQHLGEQEKWRLKQALTESFPVRYFDTLSRVRIEETVNEYLLGPQAGAPMGGQGAPKIIVPAAFLPRQCRMLLLQAYHLSGNTRGEEKVKPAAQACIRRGGGWASCLDAAVTAHLAQASPVPWEPSDADGLTIEQFLANAPWLSVQFLMAHEAAHLVLPKQGESAELEADLLGLQSMISNGTLPIGLLSGFATTSLIDEVVSADLHGSSACRALRSQQLTKRLLPKVLLLSVALIKPEKFRAAQANSDLSDSTSLLMAPAGQCTTYSPGRFDAMERDLDDLLVISKRSVEAVNAGTPYDLAAALDAFSPRTPDGMKWKTVMLFMSAMRGSMTGTFDLAGGRQYLAKIEPLFGKVDLTSLAPNNYAALAFLRAMSWYMSQPAGTSAVANARELVARFNVAQRYLPLDGPVLEMARVGVANKDLAAMGVVMAALSFSLARIIAEGCGDPERMMKPFVAINPAMVGADRAAACVELRNSSIASQVKEFGWTAN
ncbi:MULTISPECIES: hypothetical protein [unclassified Sphingomonas]|uniref:hypothetical protein n=1 Tax=Sphingomonas TaxID=13687 RepID=UPI000A5C0529|nr:MULTISPECIES: hypothetical protein [unclassified Sphingomonas]MBN8811680.1 hypothetical protein [Sphingomonas sp.]